MPASIARLSIDGGVTRLHCPVTGRPVITDEGFDESAPQSPHIRFFIDWAQTAWVPPAAQLPEHDRSTHDKIRNLLTNDELDQAELIEKCAKLLPNSCVIFELIEPARGGGHSGSVCYACFDFSDREPETVTLESLH